MVMTPQQNKTIYRAISTFGERNQTMQTLEELMELQSALFENLHRGTDNVSSITEEVADVEVMLVQIKKIYDIKEEDLDKIKENKLTRLARTIEKYTIKQEAEKQSNEKVDINKIVQIDRITSNGR